MRPNPYPTPFLNFEGIDGSGQTTQAHLLVEELEKRGISALYSKGPTKDTATGKRIYEILDNKDKVDHKEFQTLMNENHGERLTQSIIPSLEKGTWVVSDRYVFSSFAYGTAEGVDLQLMFNQTESFLTPNIIFYLAITPEEAMRRIEKRGKPLQKLYEQEESLAKNRDAYKAIIAQFPEFHVIDGMQSIEKVHEDCMVLVDQHCIV